MKSEKIAIRVAVPTMAATTDGPLWMTVKDMRELIKDLPDKTPLVVQYATGGTEFTYGFDIGYVSPDGERVIFEGDEEDEEDFGSMKLAIIVTIGD